MEKTIENYSDADLLACILSPHTTSDDKYAAKAERDKRAAKAE